MRAGPAVARAWPSASARAGDAMTFPTNGAPRPATRRVACPVTTSSTVALLCTAVSSERTAPA